MKTEAYATQMDAARKGIITDELKAVAEKEHMTTDELLPLVASGKVVIPANKRHKCLSPEGVGSMLRTKINVNLGVSRDCKDYDIEMQKVLSAVNMGAEAIMDLSSHGNTQPFRQKLTQVRPNSKPSARGASAISPSIQLPLGMNRALFIIMSVWLWVWFRATVPSIR